MRGYPAAEGGTILIVLSGDKRFDLVDVGFFHTGKLTDLKYPVTLQLLSGDSATWFMIKKTMLGFSKTDDLSFFADTFLNKVYLTTYLCVLVFVILSVILYRTRFGLRLRACGENPQAADSLGINVYKMRYAGVTISGALAGMGGFVYAMTTANCSSNGDVAGFGFLALACPR